VPELCVYALASRQTSPITLRGIADEGLHAVHVGALDAIVGRVPAIPAPTDRTLRRYADVITALWRRTPALLPARFGTSADDLDALRVMVRTREPALRRGLRSVRNRAQMTVRLVTPPDVGRDVSGSRHGPDKVRRTLKQNPQMSGTEYLRARREARGVPAFDPLRVSVKRWMREERVEKHDRIASIYHLVPIGSAERYRAALEQAAREAGVALIVSGPFPPYAFADGW